MNKKLLALLVIAVLPLMAFDCITDFSTVTVSLNLAPISATFPLNPGSSTSYGGISPAIDLSSLFDQSYTITGATLYNITVQTLGGEDLGAGSGTVTLTVNGITTTLFSYAGTWTAFNTPQSLITSSLITRNPSGVTALINAVTGRQTVKLGVSGSISKAPTMNNDAIVVSVYVQASGHK